MNSKLCSAVAAMIGVLVSVAGLTACNGDDNTRTDSPPAVVEADDDGFNGTLIDPPLRPAGVVLTNTRGDQFNFARPAPDKVTALFFGFTNCDDVCPTTMADLAAGRRTLPPALAEKVTVVFVTVDPKRDTPAVLEEWLARFDRDFIGLIGPMEQVHQLERSLYLPESGEELPAAEHEHSGDNGESAIDGADYEIDHSGSVYLFGPGGKLVLHSGGTSPKEYTDDFIRLLEP
jgi:protein SCO1/2